jgi:hypothetical protein
MAARIISDGTRPKFSRMRYCAIAEAVQGMPGRFDGTEPVGSASTWSLKP